MINKFKQSLKYFCLECVFKRIACFFKKAFSTEVSVRLMPLLIFLKTSIVNNLATVITKAVLALDLDFPNLILTTVNKNKIIYCRTHFDVFCNLQKIKFQRKIAKS